MNPWRRDFRLQNKRRRHPRSRRRRADSTSAMGGFMSKPIGWTIASRVRLVCNSNCLGDHRRGAERSSSIGLPMISRAPPGMG